MCECLSSSVTSIAATATGSGALAPASFDATIR
jgi:hypothetical protein